MGKYLYCVIGGGVIGFVGTTIFQGLDYSPIASIGLATLLVFGVSFISGGMSR